MAESHGPGLAPVLAADPHVDPGIRLPAEVHGGLHEPPHAVLVEDLEGIVVVDGGIAFNRSIMGGKLQASVQPTTDVTVATVQPGMFSRAQEGSSHGKVEIKTLELFTDRVRPLGIKAGPGGASNLPEAKVIIAAGRGVPQKENLDLIFDLARHLPHSAVGSSRPLCDAGWLEYSHQVGLTGTTVSPELYLAIGISGAQQHIVGMHGAGFVVAINTDPYAAIFNHADVCIVEDLEQFLPELISRLESLRESTR